MMMLCRNGSIWTACWGVYVYIYVCVGSSGMRWWVVSELGEGWGYLRVCVLIRISNMELCISVNVSFICRPFFVMSYIWNLSNVLVCVLSFLYAIFPWSGLSYHMHNMTRGIGLLIIGWRWYASGFQDSFWRWPDRVETCQGKNNNNKKYIQLIVTPDGTFDLTSNLN
jgi:hypothetical protein